MPEILAKLTTKSQVETLFFYKYYPDKDESEVRSLAKANINNADEFAAAQAALVKIGGNIPEELPLAVKIRGLETALLGQKIEGFVPTPCDIARDLVRYANIRDGDSVLEPSAGKGNIAEVIREMHPNAHLSVIERVHSLRQILELKGFSLVGRDFFEHQEQYDVIIQNPPFERLADIDHVYKAYSLLKQGGTLISIMSASPFFRKDKKAVEFRQWLADVGSYEHELPDNAFKMSGTSVKANWIKVTK